MLKSSLGEFESILQSKTADMMLLNSQRTASDGA